MGETGILRPDACDELIEGEIIDMAPIGTRHAWAVSELTRMLVLKVGERACVWTQNPIVLNNRSEPQPDIALLAPNGQRYRAARPSADDVYLVIEVSDATLRYDRDVKLPLYARHGIPEAWIVDLEHRVLIVCRDATNAGYRNVRTASDLSSIAPRALPDCLLDLSAIF